MLAGALGMMLLMWAKDRVEEFTRRADRGEARSDRASERQTEQGETIADAVARIASLEASNAQIADALQRLARIEEWRTLAGPKLDEVDRTANAVTALNERVKTLFNIIEDLPHRIVSELKAHARSPRPANT